MAETPHLRLRLSQLEEKINDLASVVGNNTDVFASGFDAADRRIYCLMRVFEDMVSGRTVYRVFDNPSKYRGPMPIGIDWSAYFAEYEAMLALVKLAEVHGPAAMLHEEKDEEQDDSVLVFGGDA